MRIEALIDHATALHAERTAIICGARHWTYRDLRAEYDRRAAMLVRSGLRPGDVVVNTAPVDDAVAITFLACCRADLTFVNLHVLPDPSPLIAPIAAKIIPPHRG